MKLLSAALIAGAVLIAAPASAAVTHKPLTHKVVVHKKATHHMMRKASYTRVFKTDEEERARTAELNRAQQ